MQVEIYRVEKMMKCVSLNVHAGLVDVASSHENHLNNEDCVIKAALSHEGSSSTKKVVDTCCEQVYKHPHLVCY
jgi:hypothetical protein